jgi:hypothetical protein
MREFRRNYLHHGSSKTFVFEPAKAYSERLAKSIDVLWKLKEVFELVALPGRQGGWRGSIDSYVLIQQLEVVSGRSQIRAQFGRDTAQWPCLGMPSPVEFNAEWGNTVITRPLVARSLLVLSWDGQNRPLFWSVDYASVPPLTTLTSGRPPVGKGGGRWACIDERIRTSIGCHS